MKNQPFDLRRRILDTFFPLIYFFIRRPTKRNYKGLHPLVQ